MAQAKTKGVFKIVSHMTGKEYYGASAQIETCYKDYMKWLSKGKHSNKNLQAEYDEYGKENFELVIVEEMPDAERKDLIEARKRYSKGQEE